VESRIPSSMRHQYRNLSDYYRNSMLWLYANALKRLQNVLSASDHGYSNDGMVKNIIYVKI